jgi:integrase
MAYDVALRNGELQRNSGPKPKEIYALPVILMDVVTGLRLKELTGVRGEHFHPKQRNAEGVPIGMLEVPRGIAKHRTEREIALDFTPLGRRYIAVRAQAVGRDGLLSGATRDQAQRIAQRLREFGAPTTSIHRLRDTLSTILSSAPGIFPHSVAYRESATRLGHSVRVAERHYAAKGAHFGGLAGDKTTLEAVLGIEDTLELAINSPRGVPALGTGDLVVDVDPVMIDAARG